MIRKTLGFIKKLVPGKKRRKVLLPLSAQVIPRTEHTLSRQNISQNALKVLYRLKECGFAAYLVGGSVRDLLLGGHPKDFDVATDARPEQVNKLFRNCRLIGRRFRLAHVYFRQEIVEVATFRGHHSEDESPHASCSEEGLILRDNVYGSFEEDAQRRDFTVNALYYNIADFSLVDFHNGLSDLKHRILRMIGNPEQRYREDPVRMLRAIRLAAKLDFTIEEQTAQGIKAVHPYLKSVSTSRLFDETLKLLHAGKAWPTFQLLRKYDLLRYLFAQTNACLTKDNTGYALLFIEHALKNTDQRVKEAKPVSPGFLIAAMLWPVVHLAVEQEEVKNLTMLEQLQTKVLSTQVKQISIPRAISVMVREIWFLQHRLLQRTARRVASVSQHPRFRAAYDLLLLRVEAGELLQSHAEWWTEFQTLTKEEQQVALHKLSSKRQQFKRKQKKRKPQDAAST